MKYSNLTFAGKWLTLFCLLFTLGLSGCSGSLNSDTESNGTQSGPEEPTTEVPVEPTVIPVMLAQIDATTLEPGEPAEIIVTFVDSNNGNAPLSAGEVNVSFSSVCLSKGQSNMLDDLGQVQTDFSSSDGRITARYKSNGCVGQDSINIRGDFDGVAVSLATPIVVTVNADEVARIKWVSNSHEQLVTKGVNGENVADVVFEVIGKRGARVINQEVTFSLEGLQGDPELLDQKAKSNDSGLVTVQVSAGYFPAQIIVSAEHPDASEPGFSEPIEVVRGLASYGNFNLHLNRYAPLSYERGPNQVSPLVVTASVNDRYGKPVIDNTLVSFFVEGTQPSQSQVGAIGEFIGTCRTENGVCQINWVPNGNNAPDGYVTILGVVKGEENFIDANSNGLYDAGEEFFDQPEPYLDHQQTWGWLVNNVINELNTSPFVQGEFLWFDYNKDQTRNLGNGAFDGVSCNEASGSCSDSEYINIPASVTFHQASSEPRVCRDFQEFRTGGAVQVEANAPILLTDLLVCNEYLLRDPRLVNSEALIPSGSVITFTGDGGAITGGDTYKVQGQKKLPTPMSVVFTAGQEIKVGSISMAITIPEADTTQGGGIGGDFTYTGWTWNIDIVAPPTVVLTQPVVRNNNISTLTTSKSSDDSAFYIRQGDTGGEISGSCKLSTTYKNSDTGISVDVPTQEVRIKSVDRGEVYRTDCVDPDPSDRDESNGVWTLSFSDLSSEITSVQGKHLMSVWSVSEKNPALPDPNKEYERDKTIFDIYTSQVPTQAALDISIDYKITANYVHLTGTCNTEDTTHVTVQLSTGATAKYLCQDMQDTQDTGYWFAEIPSKSGSVDVNLTAINEAMADTFPSTYYYTTESKPYTISVD